jgi:hypothetical protein
MKSSIKIIKRKQDANSIDLKAPEVEKAGEQSVEQSTREMVRTIKSWIAELQQRKRDQGHGFTHLPVITNAAVSQT